MYEFITHTWNPIKGKCYHDCSYCYMKNIVAYERPINLVEGELQGDFGLNKFIFIGSSTDEFAQDVHDEWIKEVLDFCYNKTKNQPPQDRTRFLIQTKNPKRLLDFIDHPLFDTERKASRRLHHIGNKPLLSRHYEQCPSATEQSRSNGDYFKKRD